MAKRRGTPNSIGAAGVGKILAGTDRTSSQVGEQLAEAYSRTEIYAAHT